MKNLLNNSLTFCAWALYGACVAAAVVFVANFGEQPVRKWTPKLVPAPAQPAPLAVPTVAALKRTLINKTDECGHMSRVTARAIMTGVMTIVNNGVERFTKKTPRQGWKSAVELLDRFWNEFDSIEKAVRLVNDANVGGHVVHKMQLLLRDTEVLLSRLQDLENRFGVLAGVMKASTEAGHNGARFGSVLLTVGYSNRLIGVVAALAYEPGHVDVDADAKARFEFQALRAELFDSYSLETRIRNACFKYESSESTKPQRQRLRGRTSEREPMRFAAALMAAFHSNRFAGIAAGVTLLP